MRPLIALALLEVTMSTLAAAPADLHSRIDTAAARVEPSVTPIRITASGWSVRGTGVNGRGTEICAAIAISRLAPATSSRFAAARPRTTLSITTAGIVDVF